MESFVIILTVSVIIVLPTTIYLIMQSFLKANQTLLESFEKQMKHLSDEKNAERQKEGMKIILPLRLQASERLVLFLERMQPSILLSRHLPLCINADDLTQSILSSIREEFEHNLSQQLFVSDTAWQMTKTAREEVIQLVHMARTTLPEDASAADLAKKMLLSEVKVIDHAIKKLREDLNKFG
ncbi:MAG: hypothetical protein Q8J88_06390 [Bacteroidales bacterium]|nr:hypothetical protein [Bacteroidales bacterium]